MPLNRPVRFFSQNEGQDGPSIDDPTGCWYACAQMMRVFYGGPVSPVKGVVDLDNPDGTHKGLPTAGKELSTFLRNERLLPITMRWDIPADVDAVLTHSGPIMFTWWKPGGLHASIIVGMMGNTVLYHDPAAGPNQTMSLMMINIKRTGPMGGLGQMYIRDPKTIGRWGSTPKEELGLASDGVIKKYPLPWPTGWWRVWDGGTWYYYLADKGIAMSCKTPPSPPSNTEPPAKAKIHNTGMWRTSSKSLVITWKQVGGAKKPCEETFWNAVEECQRMNANSNLYSPLVATRFHG